MDETVRKISADDINPRYNWGRALPALGIMGVDFEERVDYAPAPLSPSRARQALEKSELRRAPCLRRQQYPLHHLDQIGEWERDKLCRWALLTRGSDEPILWIRPPPPCITSSMCRG